MTFTWNVRVRFVDTDASGRIHYTATFRYFEAAEFEFLRSRGVTYDDFPDCGFPRVHVECDYKSIARNDDLLTIAVKAAHLGNSSFTYAFEATCESRPIANGAITVVCLAKSTMNPQPIPDRLRQALIQEPLDESTT